MGFEQPKDLRERVTRAAEAALAARGYASPIDLLLWMGLLHESNVRLWEKRHRAYECLAPYIQGGPKKLEQTFALFQEWAREKHLVPLQAALRGAGRDGPCDLRVTADGDPAREEFFRTWYAPADASAQKLAALERKAAKTPDLVVFKTVSEDAACAECGAEIPRHSLLFREKERSLCLACADLDHLELLPSGDAALTRRARKHSPLSAVVVEFNRRAKRYERRGVLVTAAALDQAEKECLSDADLRAARRERDAARRFEHDDVFVRELAAAIRAQFPGCPATEAEAIAAHTGRRGSGRVGRSAAGRELDAGAIRLAVIAHIRHEHTRYDELLMAGHPRAEARLQIAGAIDRVMWNWARVEAPSPS